MKIMHEIMYKLEVLYVLCVLLMGRQRNQVGAAPASEWESQKLSRALGGQEDLRGLRRHTLLPSYVRCFLLVRKPA